MDAPRAAAELQVSEDGLRVEAGWCKSLAASLAGNDAPTAAGSSVLASSAAVNAAHAGLAAASVRCAFRVQTTATKLVQASAGYGDNETSSAAQFRALRRVTVC